MEDSLKRLCECGCGGIAPVAPRTRGDLRAGTQQRFIAGHQHGSIGGARRRNPIWTASYADYEAACFEANSQAHLARRLGYQGKMVPNIYQLLRRRAEEVGFDLASVSFVLKPRSGPNGTARPLAEILVADSTYATGHLKNRLLRENILPEICVECGVESVWRGKPLVMVLDHINGVNNDHRLENLRLLCPNCNSQTDTFCRGLRRKAVYACKDCGGKVGTKKAERCQSCAIREVHANAPIQGTAGPGRRKTQLALIPAEEFANLIATTPMTVIGKMYGVSDVAVRKRAIRDGIYEKRLISKHRFKGL